ncbi:MAG TPA: zf-TFIIB domain-containing protein [bacterium]|nr:zf-TFIIB domain-containing protein [bacterium]
MESKSKREKEEQYFAEQEQLKRRKLREELSRRRDQQKAEGAKNTHWMKCPKCGQDLEEKSYEDVLIDQCQGCKGIYLDAGELELLLEGRKAKGFISKFISSVKGS